MAWPDLTALVLFAIAYPHGCGVGEAGGQTWACSHRSSGMGQQWEAQLKHSSLSSHRGLASLSHTAPSPPQSEPRWGSCTGPAGEEPCPGSDTLPRPFSSASSFLKPNPTEISLSIWRKVVSRSLISEFIALDAFLLGNSLCCTGQISLNHQDFMILLLLCSKFSKNF